MGYGAYSSTTRSLRAEKMHYDTAPREQLFQSRGMPSDMNPKGVTFRESRDSSNHPCAVPIIINLDVTGSMGNVPHEMLKKGLPSIVETLIKRGIPDPQILFAAVGDHECDHAPFQLGQFESSDDLLDHWLTTVWLEGRGGGNEGESYLLAWYAAAFHTQHDHWDKRGKKGHLFTIGDEPTLSHVPQQALQTIFGPTQMEGADATELLAKARERYHVKHLHISETPAGSRKDTVDGWKQLLGPDLMQIQSHTQVGDIIANVVYDLETSTKATVEPQSSAPEQTEDAPEDMML